MSAETTEQGTAQNGQSPNEQRPLSLSTKAARNLATTTKTPPQMQGKSSRWLLKILPGVQVSGGVYRVNRRLSYRVGDGRISFDQTGAEVRVIPAELAEISALRGFDDSDLFGAIAGQFTQREVAPGEVIVIAGDPVDQLVLIAHGKVNKIGSGEYGGPIVLGVLADGEYFGDEVLTEPDATWEFTATAVTATTALSLPRQAFTTLADQSEPLRAHLEDFRARATLPQNRRGEAAIAVASGHVGEPELPGTFVDYEVSPREYELGVQSAHPGPHRTALWMLFTPSLRKCTGYCVPAAGMRYSTPIPTPPESNSPRFAVVTQADVTRKVNNVECCSIAPMVMS